MPKAIALMVINTQSVTAKPYTSHTTLAKSSVPMSFVSRPAALFYCHISIGCIEIENRPPMAKTKKKIDLCGLTIIATSAARKRASATLLAGVSPLNLARPNRIGKYSSASKPLIMSAALLIDTPYVMMTRCNTL